MPPVLCAMPQRVPEALKVQNTCELLKQTMKMTLCIRKVVVKLPLESFVDVATLHRSRVGHELKVLWIHVPNLVTGIALIPKFCN